MVSGDVASVGAAAVAVQRRLAHWTVGLLTVAVAELLTELSAEVIYVCEKKRKRKRKKCIRSVRLLCHNIGTAMPSTSDLLTFRIEVGKGVLCKATVSAMLMLVVAALVATAVLSTEEVAIRREEVDGVLHLVVQAVTCWAVVLAVLLRLLLLLLALAAAADELSEGKCSYGVDVVAGGGGGELLQWTARRVGAGAGRAGRRVDDGAEHLPETRVEADALAADELSQRSGEFDARVLS